MKKAIALVLLIVVLLSVACTPEPPVIMPMKTGDDEVGIIIRSNGVESDSSEVVVKNLYAGARAEMVYRVHNATAKAIRHDIFLVKDADVKNYSKAGGAVKAPENVYGWLELPLVSDVNPGEIKEFVVALQMPKGAKKPAEKIGFQIGIANASGGIVQTAVGVWWLVNFR